MVGSTPSRPFRIGFVPLTDAAPLIVADALGLFARHGVTVSLSAEAGWAALRDKLAFGSLDAAHLLGPLAIALATGAGGLRRRLTVTAGLARNGNTVVLSPALAAAIGGFDVPLDARRLADALQRRADEGLPPPTLAVVFPFSSHNYLLRHWLAAGGLDPDHDVRLVVVPPPRVARALADGAIEGFCAGEPWGSHAVATGAGRFALATGDIWRDHPEKVLAFREGVAEQDEQAVVSITAAVIEAGPHGVHQPDGTNHQLPWELSQLVTWIVRLLGVEAVEDCGTIAMARCNGPRGWPPPGSYLLDPASGLLRRTVALLGLVACSSSSPVERYRRLWRRKALGLAVATLAWAPIRVAILTALVLQRELTPTRSRRQRGQRVGQLHGAHPVAGWLGAVRPSPRPQPRPRRRSMPAAAGRLSKASDSPAGSNRLALRDGSGRRVSRGLSLLDAERRTEIRTGDDCRTPLDLGAYYDALRHGSLRRSRLLQLRGGVRLLRPVLPDVAVAGERRH